MTAKRIIKNPSGYHSKGRTNKEKAVNFGLFIKEYGWSGKWEEDEETKDVILIAARGQGEQIDIRWYSNIPLQDVFYTYAGDSIKCRNVSGVALIAQEPPSQERMRSAARKGRSQLGSRISVAVPSEAGNSGSSADELIAVMATTLPFDRESTPEEIKSVLKKRRNPTITWINRLSGGVSQDIAKTWSRYLKVEANKDGKVIIHFVGEFGFHSVYLDSVIGVS
jgi:hypothetical protein